MDYQILIAEDQEKLRLVLRDYFVSRGDKPVTADNGAQALELAQEGDFDVYVSSLTTAPTGDPEYFFTTCCLSSSTKNQGGYYSEELEELASRLHTTFDADERAALASEMQQILLDDSAFLFVSHLEMGIVSKANVAGLAAHPCDYYEITVDLDIR